MITNDLGGFQNRGNWGYPNSWMVDFMENAMNIRMIWLGVALFQETPKGSYQHENFNYPKIVSSHAKNMVISHGDFTDTTAVKLDNLLVIVIPRLQNVVDMWGATF